MMEFYLAVVSVIGFIFSVHVNIVPEPMQLIYFCVQILKKMVDVCQSCEMNNCFGEIGSICFSCNNRLNVSNMLENACYRRVGSN